MKHFIEIRVKNLPATNNRDYRVKLTLPRFKNKSITLDLNNETKEVVSERFFKANNITVFGFVSECYINAYLVEFNQVEQILKAFKVN